MIYSINLYDQNTGKSVMNLKEWNFQESDFTDSMVDLFSGTIERIAPPPEGHYIAWTKASIDRL